MAVALMEYAASVGSPMCSICSLKQRREIDEALRDGVGPYLVGRWLREEVGLTITDTMIHGHKRRGHQLGAE